MVVESCIFMCIYVHNSYLFDSGVVSDPGSITVIRNHKKSIYCAFQFERQL